MSDHFPMLAAHGISTGIMLSSTISHTELEHSVDTICEWVPYKTQKSVCTASFTLVKSSYFKSRYSDSIKYNNNQEDSPSF